MPAYRYRAKKGPEDIVKGTIEAVSEKEAIEKVSHMGYIPVHIEEYNAPAETEQRPLKKPSGKIGSRHITVFSRQLASLLKSGVPILSSINIIQEQSESPYLKSVLYEVHNAVKDGAPLSAVLSQYPKVFSPLYIALVRTGEDGGTLPEALLRISDYRIKQEDMFSRLRMALAYPVLMGIVGVGTILFMLIFVMPRLMGIFVNMGQELPMPTRILISISQGLRQWWFWIVLALTIIITTVSRQLKTKAGKWAFSSFELRIPVFGDLVLKSELSRFSRTLELLVKSGIPILKAIDTSIPVLNNEIIKNQLRQSYKELEQGASFGRSLKNSKLFPLFMTNLIIVGEESGGLDEALEEVANSYEKDTDDAMRTMASLMEPLMILTMGLIIGFIVIAMLLPIFEINVMAK
jgi:type II secretory pathway component PulF